MLLSDFMSLRRVWRALPVLACFFACTMARAQRPESAGTFPEDMLPALKPILETALRQSYQVMAKQIELEQSQARVYGADALRLPNASGNLNFATNQTAISSDNSTRTRDNGIFYSFGVSQALFHWGALKSEGDKARIGVLIAQKSYEEARRTMAVALRRAYLELIVKKTALRHMRYARELTAADLKLAKEKRDTGAFSESDVGSRELNMKEVNLQSARAEIEFTGLRRSLSRLAGIAELAESAIPDEIPSPKYSADATAALLATVVRDGGRSTFQAQVAELRLREADLNVRIARVRLLPKFGASLGVSQESTTNASATSVSQQAVSRQTLAVGAQWNVFDGFATKGAKLDALASKRANELQLKSVSEATVETAQALAQQLDLDAQAMEMSAVRVVLAAALVARMNTELALGTIAQNSIDGATLGLRQAEATNAGARALFLSRWSEFASLIGADPVLNPSTARP